MTHASPDLLARPAPHRVALRRCASLASALALPVLAWLSLWAGAMVVLTAGADDRSLAWVTGSEAQLRQLEARVVADPVFEDGALLRQGLDRWRPAACDPASVAIGFSHLRPHERAAAFAALRQMIDAAGANRCPVHTFVQSDLPTPFEVAGWPSSIPALVLLVLVPGGLVLVAHLAVRGHGLVDGLWRWPPRPRARGAMWLAMTLLAAMGAARALMDPQAAASGQDVPAPAWLLMLVFAPLLEETTLRGWLQPLATRAIGPAGAVLLSSLASAALRAPTDPIGGLAGFAAGLLPALLLQATRSLPACMLANAVGMAALLLAAAARG